MVQLNSIEEALQDLQAGKPLIVVDDEHRENEGDLLIAAQYADAKAINFMAKRARGLICISMTAERLASLDIGQMVARDKNDSAHTTAFSVSVDAREGTTTGISAADRARTVQVLIDPQSEPQDLLRPGHLFPLQAHPQGVLGRAGHTEAGIDLMRLANLYPAAVICEIMNEDGTMARLPQLEVFAREHQLKIISIEDLVKYQLLNTTPVDFISTAEASLPTDYGDFEVTAYQDRQGREHLLLQMGKVEDNALVRIHSECLTGDVFGSQRCDCGAQLRLAQKKIAEAGSGLIIYMRQEGRGIGLTNKIKAYALQEKGLDTVEANLQLGFDSDERDYGLAAAILKDKGVNAVRLMTNNPEKVTGLEEHGIRVSERLSHQVPAQKHNRFYLHTKALKMNHMLKSALIS